MDKDFMISGLYCVRCRAIIHLASATFGGWGNGSPIGSGPISSGSNPGPPAKANRSITRPIRYEKPLQAKHHVV